MIVGVALVLILEWRPWHTEVEDVQVTTPPPQEVGVVTAPPAKQDIRAQLSAVNYTTITSELAARVQEVPYKEGQSFKKGEAIVLFECGTQQAQFEKTKAMLSIAERNYQTNKQLLSLGFTSRVSFENSFSEFQKAKADHDELSVVLSRCKILAPYDGLLVEQKIRSQQFVQVGQPLLEILDNSALEIEFVAPSKWSGWLVQDHKFEILLDETGKKYPARITRVIGKIDPISQTIKVVAVIDGEFKELSPGMSGVLLIEPPVSVEQSAKG